MPLLSSHFRRILHRTLLIRSEQVGDASPDPSSHSSLVSSPTSSPTLSDEELEPIDYDSYDYSSSEDDDVIDPTPRTPPLIITLYYISF